MALKDEKGLVEGAVREAKAPERRARGDRTELMFREWGRASWTDPAGTVKALNAKPQSLDFFHGIIIKGL